jgi:protein SCO1/2
VNATRVLRSWVSVLAIVALVLVGAGAVIWSRIIRLTEPEMTVDGAVPDFSLVERSGRTITRADLLGKVSVVNFFYTRCTDSCPLQSAHLARLQADLSGVPDLLLVSITVDPDHDDRDALASYAARFRADPRRWLFLTGPRPDIYRLAVDGFHLAVITSRPSTPAAAWAWMRPASAWAHVDEAAPRIIRLVHASRFALVDRQARIRSYFDGTDWGDVERLREVLGRLLRGW